MAPRKADTFIPRLAALARNLVEQRQRYDQLARLLLVLERQEPAIATSAQRLKERLWERWSKAFKEINVLWEGDAEGLEERLAAIEALLSDADWLAAEKTRVRLSQAEQALQQELEGYRQLQDHWQGLLEELHSTIITGTTVGAPVASARKELEEMQRQHEDVKRAVRDQKTSLSAEAKKFLDERRERPASLIEDLKKKIATAEPFGRMADVVLLQSPLENNAYVYAVLLGAASSPGMPGIYTMTSSIVIRQDRDHIQRILTAINEAASRGLVRRASEPPPTPDGDAPPPPAEDGAPADEAVTPAGQEARFVRPELDPHQPLPENFNPHIQQVGDLMYALLMPDHFQQYLAQTPCSLTINTNDLELPWELMCYRNAQNEDSFLCLERPIARLPMSRTFPRSSTSRKAKLRFLLIYADPDGKLDMVEREIQLIHQALKDSWSHRIDAIDVLSREEATGQKLNRLLRDGTYDVIHYAGHAAFDGNNPELSGLQLHDHELYSAHKIRRLLRGQPLVFLNACQTGLAANEQATPQHTTVMRDSPEGLAASFIYGGAMGCIGSLWPVYDKPAAAFAISFYERVLDGYPIGEAMRQARLESRKNAPEQITWAAFILYGNPTGVLVGQG